MSTQVGSVHVAVGAELSGFKKGLKSALGKAKQFAGAIAPGLGMAGLALAAGKVGKALINTSKDFESSMNVLSMAARSSGTSMQELKDAAIAVGGDTRLVGISAAEAATSMTEFYKAGLSTTDILGNLNAYMKDGAELSGAMRAAVDLQAASELDLASASEVVSVAMATFNKTADEAPGIANNLVQAADASVASVGELAAALTNVGPTAASFGWSMEDVNTALALLSQRGIKGAEAGTALKSMMTNIMRPTDKTTEALKALNVSLYDSAGVMYDLPDIMAQLEDGLSGVTQEQRNQYIQTLAGTYGMKAMNTLLAEGSAGWSDMERGIKDAATAQETATARTQGLEGALETLSGVWETLMIKVGTPFIQNVATPFVKALGDMVGVLGELDIGKAKSFFADLALVMGLTDEKVKAVKESFAVTREEFEAHYGAASSGSSEFAQMLTKEIEAVETRANAIRGSYSGTTEMMDQAYAANSDVLRGHLSEEAAILAEGLSVQATLQAEGLARRQEESAARYAEYREQHAGLWMALTEIDLTGQSELLDLQAAWLEEDTARREDNVLESTVLAQDKAMKLAEIDATFQAKMDAARTAGDAKEMGKLAAKYQDQINKAHIQFAKKDALTERDIMVEQVKRDRGRIAELHAMQKGYDDKLKIQVINNAVAQGKTDEAIGDILTSMGFRITEEEKIAIAHAKINQAMADNDLAAAKAYKETLKASILLAIESRQNSLDESLRKLNEWKPPDVQLPPIQVGGFGDVGGGGVGGGGLGKLDDDIVNPIKKKTVTVVEAVEKSAGKMAKAIKAAIEALTDVSKYTGFKDLATPLGNLVTDIKAAMHAFATLPILDMDDKIAPSLKVWADRMRSIAAIVGVADKAVKALTEKSTAFKAAGPKGLEAIRDAITTNVIPVVRGIHAAFKNLPELKAPEIGASLKLWGERMRAISSILGAVDKAVKMLVDKSAGFKSGAPKGLEAIRDAVTANIIPVVRGIHAAFKNLPVIAAEEIGKSFKEWSTRFGGIAGILDAAHKAVELMSGKADAFKTFRGMTLEQVRDQIVANVIPIVRGIHAAFKTLPTLLPKENEITASMAEWNDRVGNISGILENSLGSLNLLVDNKAIIDLVAGGMGTLRDLISNKLAPIITTISDELAKALPGKVAGAGKFKRWNEGLTEILGVVQGATDTIAKLEDLRGKSPATIQGLMAHFGNLFSELNMGFEGMDWAGTPGGNGGAGGAGMAPIQIDVHDNQLIGTTDEAMQQIATAVAAIIMGQLEVGEGVVLH